MPGLTISYQFIEPDLLKVLPGYSAEVISSTGRWHILKSGFTNYPIRVFEQDGVRFVIEGYIYDLSEGEVDSSLVSIAVRQDVSHSLIEWTGKRDGDFLILIEKASERELYLANDPFGRLPFYIHSSDERMILSREIGLIVDLVKPNVDRARAATYLVFGFVPGEQLLYEGIKKLSPYSVLSLRQDERPLIRSFFNNKELVSQVVELDANKLKEQLLRGLKNRIRICGPSALALSGGLDSRIIVAMLADLNIKMPLLTYSRGEHGSDPDVLSSNKVVQNLHRERDQRVLNLLGTDRKDVEELWRLKRGQNFLAMAYLLPFLRSFGNDHLTQITGDGGDKTLESIAPLNKIRSEKELIEVLIRKHQIISPDTAGHLLGVSVGEIREQVRNALPSELGLTYEERYRIFILRERAMNWLFEGEDRNRYYSWTVTPYYASDFFYAALRVRNEEKNFGKLFTALLSELPGDTEYIVNPNWMLPPSDPLAVRRLINRQRLKMKIPLSILSLLEKKKTRTWNEFLDQNELKGVLTNERIPDWFEGKYLIKSPLQKDIQYWTLFTLLKMIQDPNQ